MKSSTYFTKAFLQSPGADVIMKGFTDIFRSEEIQGLGKKKKTNYFCFVDYSKSFYYVGVGVLSLSHV